MMPKIQTVTLTYLLLLLCSSPRSQLQLSQGNDGFKKMGWIMSEPYVCCEVKEWF